MKLLECFNNQISDEAAAVLIYFILIWFVFTLYWEFFVWSDHKLRRTGTVFFIETSFIRDGMPNDVFNFGLCFAERDNPLAEAPG